MKEVISILIRMSDSKSEYRSIAMVDLKKQEGISQPRVVLQEVNGVFDADGDGLTSEAILFFPIGDKHGVGVLRSGLQDIVLNLFIDFLLSLIGFGFQVVAEFVFLLNLFDPQIAVDIVFVLIGEGVNLGVGLKVELLNVLDSVVLLREITQLVPQFLVLFVFEAGDIVHLLQGYLQELVQFGSQEIAYFLRLPLFER
jgi:hypothetical protein